VAGRAILGFDEVHGAGRAGRQRAGELHVDKGILVSPDSAHESSPLKSWCNFPRLADEDSPQAIVSNLTHLKQAAEKQAF
jgi:hypothetical protein